MAYFASFVSGVAAYFLKEPFPLLTLCLLLLILSTFYRKGWKSPVLILLLSLAGFFYAWGFHPPHLPPLPAGAIFEIEAGTVSLARESEGKGLFSQTIRADASGKGPREMRLLTPLALLPDRNYRLIVSVSKDSELSNPGSVNEVPTVYLREMRESERRRNLSFPLEFLSNQRTRLNAFLQGNLSQESAPFIMSIVTGERGLLQRETNKAFSRTGLAHILSISGAHFGLLLFVIFRLSRFLIRQLPYRLLVRITTYLTPDQCAAIIAAPFIVAYLGISSLSFPALRAFIMVSLFLVGLLVQREGFWLNTLLFAATVILLWSPEAILDLSFQLSFVAVLAIGIVSERGRTKKEVPDSGDEISHPRWLRVSGSYLRLSLLISLAATLATAPLVAARFHYLSLISPFTNLLFTPLIGFVILPLALFASFAYLLFGVFPLLPLLDSVTRLTLAAIGQVSLWRWADMKIAAFPLFILFSFYAGLALYLFLAYRKGNGQSGRKSPFTIIIPSALAVTPILVWICFSLLQERGIQVTYLDVGQGDAAVMELPDRRAIVMDTGRNAFQVENFLRYRGITEIEAIALSHGQADHVGGLFRLLKEFSVREVWDNGRLVYTKGLPESVRHRQLQRGDRICGKGYQITVLHPYDGFYTISPSEDEENNDSLVLRLEGRKASFLFSGDVEEEAEENIACIGKQIRSSVLKAPHHGSRTASSEAFLSVVSPEVAVISVGRDNPYRHPHEEALRLLQSAEVLRTDRDGAVKIRELPSGGLAIKKWQELSLKRATSIREEWLNIKKLFWVW
ncbi:MAG: DNA internalization-related competence protein ComEC/Rec2 [Nitrospirales bacterium]|nr:DNA internalization-related competence protein ComEC/Rec2 [Nitrospirales bacterium]